MESIETTILRNLALNESYAREVLPHLKEDYFVGSDKVLYNHINDHITKYNSMPTVESLGVMVNKSDVPENIYEEISGTINEIVRDVELPNTQWLVDETESYCKDKSLYNAIMQSVEIYDGKGDLERSALPIIIQESLSVSFNTDVGMSFQNDAKKRFEAYHRIEERIPFDIEIFNIITRGGIPKKTMNVIMGDTNVGKSLILCWLAGMYANMGIDVLYITMEMSEEAVLERLDAHMLDVAIEDIMKLTEDQFLKGVKGIKDKAAGDVIVKEFPTGSAHVGHFRHTLKELELKQKFKPQVVLIDYLNICASSRYKNSVSMNTYSYVKAIAEEVRGLAVEFNIPIWTATQSNRDGNGSADLSLSNSSDSYGVPQTSDFMLGVMALDEHPDMYLFSQLKSRYTRKQTYKRFWCGVDYSRMKLVEADSSFQETLMDNRDNQKDIKKSEDAIVGKPSFGDHIKNNTNLTGMT